jgi:hypothetical protein
MFTIASLDSNEMAAEPAVLGGLRVVAWNELRIGGRAKQGFRHFPNLPGFSSEAER